MDKEKYQESLNDIIRNCKGFPCKNDSFYNMQELVDKSYIEYIGLEQQCKKLKEQLQNISNEFLKYDWKNATQEQVYNQLKSLYESIFKEVSK